MPSSLPKARKIANDEDASQFVTPCLQDVHDATYRVAHEFPGGIPALAQRMGMSPNTLNCKVSLTVETHHTNLREAIHMQHVAKRYDILYAMASALDHICLPVPAQDAGQIHKRLAKVGAEVGDVFRKVDEALQDDSVSPRERRELTKEIHEAIAALSSVLKVL